MFLNLGSERMHLHVLVYKKPFLCGFMSMTCLSELLCVCSHFLYHSFFAISIAFTNRARMTRGMQFAQMCLHLHFKWQCELFRQTHIFEVLRWFRD